MGGEGSISHMIATLRNNKNLLRGRNRFFRRELTYSELRDYYKDSKVPLKNGKIDKEYLKKVRNQLLKDQRKARNKQILIISIAVILVSSVFWSISSLSFSKAHSNQNHASQKLKGNHNEKSHHEMLILGLE